LRERGKRRQKKKTTKNRHRGAGGTISKPREKGELATTRAPNTYPKKRGKERGSGEGGVSGEKGLPPTRGP